MTLTETIIGGLAVLLIGWIVKQFFFAWDSISKENMFSICFVDHDPPGSREIDRRDFYRITLGRSQHWVKVVTKEGLDITDFNIRFLSEQEVVTRPEDHSPDDIRLTIQILEVNVTPEIIAQGVTSIQTNDRHGGIDVKFRPAYPLGTGRAIFLRVDIDAKQIWSGKISFRGYDKDHHTRYARTDVRVVAPS
jgi:hypothetical protein